MYLKNNQHGLLALGTAVIFSGALVTTLVMNKEQTTETSLLLYRESIKDVLATVSNEAAAELGVFIPKNLVVYDGTDLKINPSVSAPMQWQNAGINLKKTGCLKILQQNETCSEEDIYEVIARVTGSPSAPDETGVQVDYLKLNLSTSVTKAILGGRVEKNLGVYIKRAVLTASTCPYLDESLEFRPTFIYHTRQGRYHFEGWAKVKPEQNFAASLEYPVSLTDWSRTFHYTPDHNWRSFPQGQNIDVYNYYLRINGWASWASLIVPKSKPQECIIHFQGFRKNNFNLGCFVAGTQIAVSDTSTKSVELLKKGDEVYNPVTRKLQKIKRVVAGPEQEKDLIELSFGSNRIVVTRDHPMLTSRGYIQAGQMKPEDLVKNARGEWIKPEELRSIPAHDRVVYNFELEGNGSAQQHVVVANSLMTGDLLMQNRLVKEQTPRTKREHASN